MLAASLSMGSSACELVLGGIPSESELGDPAAATDSGAPASGEPHADGGREEDASSPEAVADASALEPQAPAPEQDAGTSAPPLPCSGPTIWYADEDRDGYGVGNQVQTGCPKPEGNWATRDGDCADDDPRVYPSQTMYFGEPYLRADGVESYDFDCSGVEEGHPAQPLAAARCDLLAFPMCGGSGYLAGERSGAGLNPVCGSTTERTCKPSAAIVLCQPVSTSIDEPYLCR